MPLEDWIHPLLKHYTAAPQWVKSFVGTAYSAVPVGIRYGRKAPEFLDEIKITDPAILQRRAGEKMFSLLDAATRHVPAYQHLRDVVTRPGATPLEMLSKFPLLSKQELKASLADYVSAGLSESMRMATFTGGSTSVPMKLYWHRHVTRPKSFAYNGEFDRIAGIGDKDVTLALRGRSVPGAGQPGQPLWMYDPIKRYLHLSSDHLEAEHMPAYIAAIEQWQPTFIHAFPSAITPLAKWLEAHPVPAITERIKCIQLFSENIYDHQVELLKRVFGCEVLCDYGHSEGAIKSISLPGDSRYFFWPLYGYVELIDFDGNPITEPGVLGEIVATGFDNLVMPLIRYRTGDMAMWSAQPNTLRPGFQVVDRIEGRLQEFLVCRDHRLVSICTIGAAHFEQLADADRMQFEQHETGRATLKVISREELPANVKTALADGIRKKTQGGLEVEVVRVDEIPRTRIGKHRLLVQHLDISSYLGAAHIDDEESALS